MVEPGARRSPRKLSAVIGIRRTVKDAAMAEFARGPGRPAKERDWQLEAARVGGYPKADPDSSLRPSVRYP